MSGENSKCPACRFADKMSGKAQMNFAYCGRKEALFKLYTSSALTDDVGGVKLEMSNRDC